MMKDKKEDNYGQQLDEMRKDMKKIEAILERMQTADPGTFKWEKYLFVNAVYTIENFEDSNLNLYNF